MLQVGGSHNFSLGNHSTFAQMDGPTNVMVFCSSHLFFDFQKNSQECETVVRPRRNKYSWRCDQQLTCLVSLLKICDIMGAAILFFVLKYEVLIVLPDTHELLLCSIWLLCQIFFLIMKGEIQSDVVHIRCGIHIGDLWIGLSKYPSAFFFKTELHHYNHRRQQTFKTMRFTGAQTLIQSP